MQIFGSLSRWECHDVLGCSSKPREIQFFFQQHLLTMAFLMAMKGAHMLTCSHGCVIICCGIAHIYMYVNRTILVYILNHMICRLADQTFFVLFFIHQIPAA